MLNAKPRFAGHAAGLALLLTSWLAACGAPAYDPDDAKSVTDAGRQTETSVGDPAINKKLEIHNVRSRRTAEQLLQVEFELYNRTSSGVDFEWAVLWYDASNFRIEAPLRFQRGSLARKSSRTITIEAPSPLATGWQLCVEKPRG